MKAMPPQGAPWDMPFDEVPLVFVDLEMTGLDPTTHRVVQMCLQRVVGGELVGELTSLVKPDDSATVGNSKVHGITAEHLKDAPDFSTLATELGALLDGTVLVAHAAKHDVAFLAAELKRVGVSWCCEHFIDTLALSRRVLEQPSHRLVALAEALAIPNPRPHRADNDVAVTRALFEHLVGLVTPKTARELWSVCKGKRRAKPEILERAQQAVSHRQPARVGYRPNRGPAQELLFVATAVRTDLDPPVVLGYLLPTRGRRELRADRITSFELIPHESAT
jgi:DNA polymerase-3 subunit epsilon